jgi:replicative DNA helicase
MEADLANPDYSPGIPTGFAPLDKMIGGWRKNQLYIFAAPPGWGKSAFLLCASLNALKQGRRVLFISLEMPVPDLIERLICIQARVDSARLRQRRALAADELERIRLASTTLANYEQSQTFIIARLKRPTMTQIRAKIEEYQFNPGFDLIALDYAYVNKIADDERLAGDENAQMAYIYSELEAIKEDYDAPFLTATQMNQKWDSRKGKRPGETDLMHGSVGRYAADVIGYIYHKALARPDDRTLDRTVAEIIFRKNRYGSRTGICYLRWEETYTRFSDSINELEQERLRREEDEE